MLLASAFLLTSAAAGGTEYRSAKGGYSLRFPPDWTVNHDDPAILSISAPRNEPHGDCLFVNWRNPKTASYSRAAIDEMIRERMARGIYPIKEAGTYLSPPKLTPISGRLFFSYRIAEDAGAKADPKEPSLFYVPPYRFAKTVGLAHFAPGAFLNFFCTSSGETEASADTNFAYWLAAFEQILGSIAFDTP